MLLANPSALASTIRQQNENFNQSEVAQKHSEYLNQLDADLLQSIKNGNYGIMQGFIKDNNLLKKVFKWMVTICLTYYLWVLIEDFYIMY